MDPEWIVGMAVSNSKDVRIGQWVKRRQWMTFAQTNYGKACISSAIFCIIKTGSGVQSEASDRMKFRLPSGFLYMH